MKTVDPVTNQEHPFKGVADALRAAIITATGIGAFYSMVLLERVV